jgi:hypothetical protein
MGEGGKDEKPRFERTAPPELPASGVDGSIVRLMARPQIVENPLVVVSCNFRLVPPLWFESALANNVRLIPARVFLSGTFFFQKESADTIVNGNVLNTGRSIHNSSKTKQALTGSLVT